MSAFASPSWDIDVSANHLCDSFSAGTKGLGRNRKKKQRKIDGQNIKQKHLIKSGLSNANYKPKSKGKWVDQETPSVQVPFRKKQQQVIAKIARGGKEKVKRKVISNKSKFHKNVSEDLYHTNQTLKKVSNHKKQTKFSEATGDDATHQSVFSSDYKSKNRKLKKSNTQNIQKNVLTDNKCVSPGKFVLQNSFEHSESFQNQKKSDNVNHVSNFNNLTKKKIKNKKMKFLQKQDEYVEINTSNLNKIGNKKIKTLPHSFKNKDEQARDHGKFNSKNIGNNRINHRKRNSSRVLEVEENLQTKKKRKITKDTSDTSVSSSNVMSNSSSYIKNTVCDVRNNKIEDFSVSGIKNKKKETTLTNKDAGGGRKDSTYSQNTIQSPFIPKNRFKDASLPLRERMILQLKSSRFRYINEQLYTSDSRDAEEMFKKDPDLFQLYHDGFKRQVEQWPLNPIEKIIKSIKRRPENLVIADFGCGDALLARSVKNKVHSFDLVALSDEVTVCDMANTPLESNSVDVCVFCLSLMGTNLGSYLIEANRVLKMGGALKIAEVASRFDNVEHFVKDMKKYGFRIVNKDLSHNLFYFIYFSKESDVKIKQKLPALTLKPCLYKKR